VTKNPQIVTIETPEHVELQFRLAGIGTRFLAFLVDRLIQAGIIFALAVIVILMVFLSGHIGLSSDLPDIVAGHLRQWIIAAAILLYGVVIIGYFILFEYLWSGSTPGKRSQDIRVIRKDGRPITFVHASVRNILRSVDLLGEVYPVCLAVMFIDPMNRRLGDLAAGTLVVADSGLRKPVLTLKDEDRLNSDTEIRRISEGMSVDEYRLASKFLARREGLEELHRQELAQEIYERIFRKAPPPGFSSLDQEAALEQVGTLYREKTRVL